MMASWYATAKSGWILTWIFFTALTDDFFPFVTFFLQDLINFHNFLKGDTERIYLWNSVTLHLVSLYKNTNSDS